MRLSNGDCLTDVETIAQQQGPSPRGLLAGYRVLDCSGELGAFCTRLLAELRAEVLKVEPPTGDPARYEGPFVGNEIGPERSLSFLHYHAGKRSITLSLDHADGKALFRQLIQRVDVLVESFPAEHLEHRGLDRAALAQLNRRLVHVSVTPYGLSGPRASWQASDLTLMASCGLMQMCGSPSREPLRMGGQQSRHITGMYAALATAMALHARELSGEGQFVEISAQEAMAPVFQESGRLQAWPLTGILPQRQGHGRQVAFPYGSFPCRDGFVAITATEQSHWAPLAAWIHEVTGDELILDPMFAGTHFGRGIYTDMLEPLLEDFTRRFDRRTLFEEGQRRGVPLFPVNEIPQLLEDEQLGERGVFVPLAHPAVGPIVDNGTAIRVSDGLSGILSAAPLLGEANVSVYSGELGLTHDQLAALRRAGAI